MVAMRGGRSGGGAGERKGNGGESWPEGPQRSCAESFLYCCFPEAWGLCLGDSGHSA